MSTDSLSLENIDEFVNDENKVVTVKWLSLTLKVHCNTAKQLLYKFVENERNIKGNDKITVTYFVSGLSKPDENGEQAFKFAVVPESKLETYKSTLNVLTSCHVYSVQKIKLKDSNALYMTDYEKLKENIYDSNRYSSIHYDKAVLCSEDDLDLLRVPLTSTKEETDKKTPVVSNGVAPTKPAEKKGPQSAIANMFAKSNQQKMAAKTDQKTEDKGKKEVTDGKKNDKKDTAKASDKKGGGMMSFFPKQSEKKEEASVTKKPEKKDNKKATKGASKKSRPLDSDDEEESIGKSKRRRVKPDILDSSSEEEMDAEDEEPIPPTPPRQPSPAPREPSPAPREPSLEPEPSPRVEDEEDPVPKGKTDKKDSVKGERKRKRTRKLVPKTYMDKDGFMVTEKVWQSESEDASESEEPVAKVTKTTEPSKSKTSPAKGKQKGSPKKKSPQGKKGPGSGGSAKQTSLMSFFKKS